MCFNVFLILQYSHMHINTLRCPQHCWYGNAKCSCFHELILSWNEKKRIGKWQRLMTCARNQFLLELDPNQQSYIPPSNTLRDNQSHFIFICSTSELAVFVNLKPRATQAAMFVTLLTVHVFNNFVFTHFKQRASSYAIINWWRKTSY